MWKKIINWLKERGVILKKYKHTLYFFLSMLVMVFIVNVFNIAPLIAGVIILVLNILKQFIWDVIINKQKFDLIDIIYVIAGILTGLLFTGAWYKIR